MDGVILPVSGFLGYAPPPPSGDRQRYQICMICAVLLVIILFMDKLD